MYILYIFMYIYLYITLCHMSHIGAATHISLKELLSRLAMGFQGREADGLARLEVSEKVFHLLLEHIHHLVLDYSSKP